MKLKRKSKIKINFKYIGEDGEAIVKTNLDKASTIELKAAGRMIVLELQLRGEIKNGK